MSEVRGPGLFVLGVKTGHGLTHEPRTPLVTFDVSTLEHRFQFDMRPNDARVLAEALLDSADKADRKAGL